MSCVSSMKNVDRSSVILKRSSWSLRVDSSITKTVTSPWTVFTQLVIGCCKTRTALSLVCVINEQTWDDSERKILRLHRGKRKIGSYLVIKLKQFKTREKETVSTVKLNLSYHGEKHCQNIKSNLSYFVILLEVVTACKRTLCFIHTPGLKLWWSPYYIWHLPSYNVFRLMDRAAVHISSPLF